MPRLNKSYIFNTKEFRNWRKKVVDAVFKFFALFGILAYIPSMYLSIAEELWLIAILDTLVYILAILLAVKSHIPYIFKGICGASIFWILGVALIIVLGPIGAGEVWLFAATVMAAFFLGEIGAFISFFMSICVYIVVFFLIKNEYLLWDKLFGITKEIWLTKSINYIILNFSIVIINSLYLRIFRKVLKRTAETRNAAIFGLAKLAEYRDKDTGEHLSRIQDLCEKIARELQKHSKYKDYITEAYISDLKISSLLHDIGKVGISDSILLKEGPLTEIEFLSIKKHTEFGEEAITEMESHMKGKSLFSLGKEIALCHHERWDGKGYPNNLKGESIPLSARIVSIADVYDALTSTRPYKEAFTHDKALKIINEWNGTHFDPEIVEAFLKIINNPY